MPIFVPADPRWKDLAAMQAALDAEPVIGPSPRRLVDTSTWGPQFPTWVYDGGVASDSGPPSSGSANAVATKAQERQLTLAAANAPIRFGYGRDRIGAQLMNVLVHGSYVVVQLLWGYPLYSIESLQLDDKDLDASVLRHDYLDGTQSAVDSYMEAAFAAQTPPIDYNDTLAGFSYTALKIPVDKFESVNFTAIVNWRKVYDPRGTPGYNGTDNPSLALADFLTNTVYGEGLNVDWSSVGTCADWNDTLLSGEKMRRVGWTLDKISKSADVRETLRMYASVFTRRRGGTVYFVPDKAEDSCATYAHANGDFASVSDIEKADLNDAPTIVEVIYTDASKVPWRDASAFSPPLPDEVTRRLSTIRLPGIHSHEQAYREAVERLNKLTLNDLSFSIVLFDIGIKHEVGNVITVTLPFAGVTSKLMRVVGVRPAGAGQWMLDLREYDPSMYSTAVVPAPSYGDTELPLPSEPPTPDSVSAAEELFQQADGSWNSRLRITVDPVDFLWLAGYRIEVYDNLGNPVDAATVSIPSYGTPPLDEGVSYTIKAASVSITGASSGWAQTNKTFYGKLAPPTDVASITGFEIAGSVFLSWSASNDLDLRDYEIRYAGTDAGWASATMVDRVLGLRTEIKGVLPAGAWWFYVKARDTVGGYSTNAAKCQVTVTLDPNALQTEAYDGTPTTSGMDSYTERDGSVYDQTRVGTTSFGSQFTNSLGTYTNEIGAYWAGTFSWEAAVGDPWGVLLSGDWNVDWVHLDVEGTATKTLRLSEDNSNWTDHTTLPAKDTARYAKVKLNGTGAIKVKRSATRIYVNAVTREEVGNSESLTYGKTIELTNEYYTWRNFTIVPYGTASNGEDSYAPYIDNIVMGAGVTNSFDVWLMDSAGSPVSGIKFNWSFRGV